LSARRRLSRAFELAGSLQVDAEDSNFVIEYMNGLLMRLRLVTMQISENALKSSSVSPKSLVSGL
jgi:hypothetical protein